MPTRRCPGAQEHGKDVNHNKAMARISFVVRSLALACLLALGACAAPAPAPAFDKGASVTAFAAPGAPQRSASHAPPILLYCAGVVLWKRALPGRFASAKRLLSAGVLPELAPTLALGKCALRVLPKLTGSQVPGDSLACCSRFQNV